MSADNPILKVMQWIDENSKNKDEINSTEIEIAGLSKQEIRKIVRQLFKENLISAMNASGGNHENFIISNLTIQGKEYLKFLQKEIESGTFLGWVKKNAIALTAILISIISLIHSLLTK